MAVAYDSSQFVESNCVGAVASTVPKPSLFAADEDKSLRVARHFLFNIQCASVILAYDIE